MRARLLGLMVTLLLAGSVAACASEDKDVRAIPTFPSAQPGRVAAKARDTLLPNDCADALSGVTMSALLAQPVDSVQSRAVVGISAPAVGRLEKVTCLYRRASKRGGPPDVELNLYAYTDPAAAEQHVAINVQAERAEARTTEDFSIGTAPATLLTEAGQSMLFVRTGRSAISVLMRDGVMPADQLRPVMVDLAQRVLPNLAPDRPREPR